MLFRGDRKVANLGNTLGSCLPCLVVFKLHNRCHTFFWMIEPSKSIISFEGMVVAPTGQGNSLTKVQVFTYLGLQLLLTIV